MFRKVSSIVEFSKNNGVTYLQFPLLLQFENIRHAVFTRRNGHSPTPYNSLNTSAGVGDHWKHVRKNRAVLAEFTGSRHLCFSRQTHGKTIVPVSAKDDFKPFDPGFKPPVGDGMTTSARERYLCIQVADCQPVLLIDPKRRAVANVHIGWRGSVGNIATQAVSCMRQWYRSDPADLHAGIGPSLGPCCAEFVDYKSELPETFWSFQSRPYYFDFWAITRHQLQQAGLSPDHIADSGLCTRCRSDLFFSYRGEGVTGRFTALIGLV